MYAFQLKFHELKILGKKKELGIYLIIANLLPFHGMAHFKFNRMTCQH